MGRLPALAGVRSRRARAKQRKGICLRDVGVTAKTHLRYHQAVSTLMKNCPQTKSVEELDDYIASWIEQQFSKGAPLNIAADALSGIHYFIPSARRCLPASWKLFSVWRKIEVPSRAPPLTGDLLWAMAGKALENRDFIMPGLLACCEQVRCYLSAPVTSCWENLKEFFLFQLRKVGPGRMSRSRSPSSIVECFWFCASWRSLQPLRAPWKSPFGFIRAHIFASAFRNSLNSSELPLWDSVDIPSAVEALLPSFSLLAQWSKHSCEGGGLPSRSPGCTCAMLWASSPSWPPLLTLECWWPVTGHSGQLLRGRAVLQTGGRGMWEEIQILPFGSWRWLLILPFGSVANYFLWACYQANINAYLHGVKKVRFAWEHVCRLDVLLDCCLTLTLFRLVSFEASPSLSAQ